MYQGWLGRGLLTTSILAVGTACSSGSQGTLHRHAPSQAGAAYCLEADGADGHLESVWRDERGEARAIALTGNGCARQYRIQSTASLRDPHPPNPRVIAEPNSGPRVRTRNTLFDALYAMALLEARENSVDSIEDKAFNGGEPVACGSGGCFETGMLWKYVWTRDISYSVHLALAALDPARSRNSLLFKLSERRQGGDRQIVQDTGSGGSYPISTDRVVWALGARELLKFLDGPERAAFLDLAYEAIRNTVEHDRAVIFRADEGLYQGEQSYLDWREQSYPGWTADDTVHIGMSRALSTNVLHLNILKVAGELARLRGEIDAASRYETWQLELRHAIRQRFYLPDEGLFSTYLPTFLDSAPVRRFDLLGSALAIVLDVATPEQAAEVVSRYPHLPKGPPVQWPQEKGVPIYHNRALWPFVTAYWLRAARKVGNSAAVNNAVTSMMGAAALQLSNMENLEMVSGLPWLDDGSSSGPVINSPRQLWSVAGYLSMVHDVIFGVQVESEGIRFRPYVTRTLRNTVFTNADTLVLDRYPYRGRAISVVLHLPPRGGGREGAYVVGALRLDGRTIDANAVVAAAEMSPTSRLDIELVEPREPDHGSITLVTELEGEARLFAPRAPRIAHLFRSTGAVAMLLDSGGEPPGHIAFSVYRDGHLLASGLPGSTREWIDKDSAAGTGRAAHCYTAESYSLRWRNRSHRSPPICIWGLAGDEEQTFSGDQLRALDAGGVAGPAPQPGDPWGGEGQGLIVTAVRPRVSGEHIIQVVGANGAGPINTGITCAVKKLQVREARSQQVVASGMISMPHTGGWREWRGSSLLRVGLSANKSYEILILDSERAVNMSAFAHFSSYGGKGGRDGPYNQLSIKQIVLRPSPGVRLGP